MDQSRAQLPVERGPPGRTGRQLAQQHHISTDSTSSVESMMTQVPLPFHQPPQYQQPAGFVPRADPYITPNITQDPTMPPLPPRQPGIGRLSLNPRSPTYYPGYEQNDMSINAQNEYQGQIRGTQPAFGSYNTGGSANPYHQSSMGILQNNGLWVPNGSTQNYQLGFQGGLSTNFGVPGGPAIGPQYGQQQYADQQPYTTQAQQYPPQAAYDNGSNYGGVGLGVQNGNFGISGTNDYGQYGGAHTMRPFSVGQGSPTMTYTTTISPVMSHQALPYNAGAGNAAISNQWGSLHGNNFSNSFPYTNNQATTAVQDGDVRGAHSAGGISDVQSVSSGSNLGRGKKRKKANSKKNDPFGPVGSDALSILNNALNRMKLKDGKLGGPILPASNPFPEMSASPERGAATARHQSSNAQSLESSSSCETPIKASQVMTPKNHKRGLSVNFNSEKRSLTTPMLQATRAASLTSAITDPARKQNITSWLENTPTGLSGPNQLGINTPETIKRVGSPPRMIQLYTGNSSAIKKSLTEQSDPFGSSAVTTFNPTPYNTPFKATIMTRGGMSKELALLTRGATVKPSAAEALDGRNLPFSEFCRLAKADDWGVIKIKNIPYSVNRQEILAFLGRNARLVAEQDGEAVHIIMERVTSKTLDCYIEFVNFSEAVAAVNRFENNRINGRGGRLGQRHVDVELSTQENLMADLFPKAKNVVWKGGRPKIIPRDFNDKYNSGFVGFVSREELVMLVKHVEAPQRSPFSKECPQRPFECLISTLQKYPWYMVDNITIEDRNLLYNATMALLNLLMERINNNTDPLNLNNMLLKRVWRAALKCCGFTPTMKDNIVCTCSIDESFAQEIGIAPYASYWKDLWTIGAKPNTPSDLVLWYVTLIREATETEKKTLSLAEQAASGDVSKEIKLFGDIRKYIGHDSKELAHMTLAQVAQKEWAAIELLLRRALTPAIEGRY